MKNRLVILLITLVFSCNTFSQESSKINGNKLFEELFAKVEASSSGDLCIKTKEYSGGFLIIIDGLEEIASVPNHTYCAKSSIIFIGKEWNLQFDKKKNGHWKAKNELIDETQTAIIERKGDFMVQSDRTLKQID